MDLIIPRWMHGTPLLVHLLNSSAHSSTQGFSEKTFAFDWNLLLRSNVPCLPFIGLPFSSLENPLVILPEDSKSLLNMAKELHKKIWEIFERVKVGCLFRRSCMMNLLMGHIIKGNVFVTYFQRLCHSLPQEINDSDSVQQFNDKAVVLERS